MITQYGVAFFQFDEGIGLGERLVQSCAQKLILGPAPPACAACQLGQLLDPGPQHHHFKNCRCCRYYATAVLTF